METSQTRFDELKAVGWANLNGEQRKEYNALKAELEGGMVEHTVTQEDLDANPDLVEQGIAVGDVIEVNKDDVSPETLHETAEINDTSDLSNPPTEPVATPEAPVEAPFVPQSGLAQVAANPVQTASTGQFVMTENVRHDGVDFKAGQDIAADHKALPTFLADGFAREKKLS